MLVIVLVCVYMECTHNAEKNLLLGRPFIELWDVSTDYYCILLQGYVFSSSAEQHRAQNVYLKLVNHW